MKFTGVLCVNFLLPNYQLPTVPVHLIRNPRGTNWVSFREDLRDRLERGPEMNMKSEAGLGLAIHWVQQVLISAYEDNCPLRPVKTGTQSLKWRWNWNPSEEE